MTVKGHPGALLLLSLHVGCQSTSQAVSFGALVWPESPPPNIFPQLEEGITDVISTKGYDAAFAALGAGGQVVTWGNSYSGGDSSVVEAKLRGNVTALFSTEAAFAALKFTGEVVTWGTPTKGGYPDAAAAKLRSNVIAIFSTLNGFAALKASGEVVLWGTHHLYGSSSGVEAKLRGNVYAVFSTAFDFAALKVGGEVVTWRTSSDNAPSSALQAKLRRNVTALFRTDFAFAAQKAGGEVVIWGGPKQGDSSSVEAKLRGNVTAIFSTPDDFAALRAGGEVVTWGHVPRDREWSLPIRQVRDSSAAEAKLRSNVTALCSTAEAFAALNVFGEVVTWGVPPIEGEYTPAVEAKLRGNVTAIFNNRKAFAALKVHGELVTWGGSWEGGDSSAVEAKLRGNVTALFSTEDAFAALNVFGEVVTWGVPSSGGDSTAVEAKLRSNVTALFSNYQAFAALTAVGEVVTWGSSDTGGDSSGVNLQARVTVLKTFKRGFGALICIPRRQSRTNPTSSCQLCSSDAKWSGLVHQCQRCASQIQVPNDDQSSCESCKAGFIPDSNKTMCTECAGNSFSKAMSSVCQMCPIGQIPNDDKSACKSCASEQIAEDGLCKSCPSLFHPNDLQIQCVPDFGAIAVRIVYIILISMFVKLLFAIFSRRFVVIDVSLNHGKAILTTLTDHYLSCPPYRPTFPIQLQGTCHPGLDASDNSKPQVARAKVEGRKSLELLDFKGNSLEERFDTSKGTLLLTYTDAFLHVSLLRIPLALPASAILLAILLLAIYNLEAAEACVLSMAAVLTSCILWSFMRWRQSYRKTPLDTKLVKFRSWLSTVNPKPTSCPKGPGRAISLDKLLQTHHAFRTFIQDRTAYYLHGNILMPLTAKYRLSYAELVGPKTVDFFVSHFWGTEFTHFCSSLQKHAETVAMPLARSIIKREKTQRMAESEQVDPNAQKQQVAYWICFCSNNQYDIHNELGGDIGWRESSFYLALQSPSCQCSCMVLDDKALPLTRSWCIFETLQALQLSQKRSGFELLMCTASGVLNFGNASIEAAIGVVKRVSCMNLQDAQASSKADKVMIDRLVLEEMGSFEKLNNFIRDEIHVILETAQQTCTSEFQNLFTILETSRQMEASERASTSQRRSSSNSSSSSSSRQSELQTLYGRSVETRRKRLEMKDQILEMKKDIEEQEEELEMKLAKIGLSLV